MGIVIYMIVIVLLLLSFFYESNVYQRKKKADQQTRKQELCDKLSQSDLRVNLHFEIENEKEDKFADYTAVYGYPNYLFRTDSKQKWTNEETEDNFCLFRSEDITNTDWKYYEETATPHKECAAHITSDPSRTRTYQKENGTHKNQ